MKGAHFVELCDQRLIPLVFLLAAYKRPRKVVFVSGLPTTSIGKIMRRKLGEATQSVE
jgi:acyl-coenzyme A synthetase/AMP-(fatty) acid ligase